MESQYGIPVWAWPSDPFGTTQPDEDADGDGVTFTYNLRFPGQYYDDETKLHYNYFRCYDPGIGRYVQSDPIGLGGGLNTFTYSGGDPLGAIDPDGLAHIFIWRPGGASAYGHAAVLSDSGNYLSHHPDREGLSPLQSRFRTIAEDYEAYQRSPDFVLHVDLPDEQALNEYIESHLQEESYWGPFNNGADAVHEGLDAGRADLEGLAPGIFDMISYPSALEDQLRESYWLEKRIVRDVAR